ncbi:MAG: hypothetical protein WD397_08725 [Wenzhouxiangellaceae bacterium]
MHLAAAIFLSIAMQMTFPPDVVANPPPDTHGKICPSDEHRLRTKLERFLFPVSGRDPIWAEEAPGLAVLTGRHDIQPLTEQSDARVCKELSREYAEFIEKTTRWPEQKSPYHLYDVVFYKAADFYFVVIAHAPIPQPDDPFEMAVTTGRDRFVVYDQNLHKLLAIMK